MIQYDIKTWRCGTCDYAYSGAIEPDKDQLTLVFPGLGLEALDCPSCKLRSEEGTLERATDPAKKVKHVTYEESDIPLLRAEKLAKGEHKDKVDKELQKMKFLSAEEVNQHRQLFEDNQERSL